MRKKDFYVAPGSEVLELAFEQAILDGSETSVPTLDEESLTW